MRDLPSAQRPISPGIPPIIGWPEDSFIEIMDEYRQKKRQQPDDADHRRPLSNDEIAALAAYFGSLKPQAARHNESHRAFQGGTP